MLCITRIALTLQLSQMYLLRRKRELTVAGRICRFIAGSAAF